MNWVTAAETNLLGGPGDYCTKTVDSKSANVGWYQNGAPINPMDGNLDTFWVTEWYNQDPASLPFFPFHFTIDIQRSLMHVRCCYRQESHRRRLAKLRRVPGNIKRQFPQSHDTQDSANSGGHKSMYYARGLSRKRGSPSYWPRPCSWRHNLSPYLLRRHRNTLSRALQPRG